MSLSHNSICHFWVCFCCLFSWILGYIFPLLGMSNTSFKKKLLLDAIIVMFTFSSFWILLSSFKEC